VEDNFEAREPFREEDFREICDHLERLYRLLELGRKFRDEGLEKNEFKELIDLIVEAIKHNAERELLVVRMLQWLKEAIDRLPLEASFSPKRLKERLPRGPAFPAVHELRGVFSQVIAPWLDLPPPPPPLTPSELVDELDALVDGFMNELRRHVQLLLRFFDVISPEGIPWIVKFVEKNPGHVRTSLGEPLCIWWLQRVLGESREVWRGARGPEKVNGVEVDALSETEEGLAVAEIKISKSLDKLEEGCRQVVRAIERLSSARTAPGYLEVAVVTLYDLGERKERVRSVLRGLLDERGINAIAAVYDINDVKKTLEGWRSEAKERYLELFDTLAKILESTQSRRDEAPRGR